MHADLLLDGASRDQQTINADWQFTNLALIEGVTLKEIRHVPTGYGALTEIFRSEWKLDPFPVEQVFQSTLMPGRISAWHAHEFTTDRLFVNRGMMRVALFDGRRSSPTYGLIN